MNNSHIKKRKDIIEAHLSVPFQPQDQLLKTRTIENKQVTSSKTRSYSTFVG
jgi:hypothetical protein